MTVTTARFASRSKKMMRDMFFCIAVAVDPFELF
jgi:hypothetical protein